MKKSPVALLLLAVSAGAQMPAPEYDAASVKLNRSGSNGMGGTIGIKRDGALSMRNVPVRMLIEIAYEQPDYALSSTPSWTDSSGYDIEAKPPQPVDYKTAQLMMQNLLAVRFGLRVHHETGEVTGFRLVVDKGGSKLKPSEAPGVGFRIQSTSEIQGPAGMPMLARYLKAVVRAPVEDQTGLTGNFDIAMKWTPDTGASAAASTASDSSITVFDALRQQLGLALDKTKVSIDRLIVDRVDRPTEN